MAKQWHFTPLNKLIKDLRTHQSYGLSTGEAKQRLARLGANVLVSAPRISPWLIFINQFRDFMVLVLLGTTIISLFLGETLDAAAILAIVLLNSILGFVQEYKAERSLDALRKLTTPHSKVLRDGHQGLAASEELVPGDIIFLEAGDRVPADCRLVESQSLSVDESNLTGESVAVTKDQKWTGRPDTPLGDLKNVVFKGTLVTAGYAKAVVATTGMDTEIGEIAHLLQEKPAVETPLQRRLEQLGRILVLACFIIVAIVFAAGVKQGFPVYRMFMVGVTLAVAAIPEGLPAVVTIALSVGVQRMSKRNAIVRQLPAVETLGCATVICSDKTGTLTQNEMQVQKIWTSQQAYSLLKGEKLAIRDKKISLYYTVLIGALCTKAAAYGPDDLFGDPTEVALLRLALENGFDQQFLKREFKEIDSLPFDAQRKRMAVAVQRAGEFYSFVKGAPDLIMQRCSHILSGTEVVNFNQKWRKAAADALREMTGGALRVLATAYKPLGPRPGRPDQWEEGLILTGLVGMMDPPRPEVPAAVAAARRGGIRTIMVTGDHKRTAEAVAKKIGLLTPQANQVLTGAQWEQLTPLEQQARIKETAVFARVAPTHKLSIVRALQKNGEIVAVTGDGVNDAPAVKEADIGISMGIQGTDVTREASAMILVDDNYETIISAIREGRGIYDNIRKFIRYLLGCNVGEVLTMLIAALAGLPLPLVPMQILWMNLVTDGLPAIALGLEPMEQGLMLRPPRSPREGVFARRLLRKILFSGIVIGASALAIFVFSLRYFPADLDRARTLAFTTLVFAQLIFVFQCRSEHLSIFEIGFWGNLYLTLAVVISAGAQIFVLYNPFMQKIFKTTPLNFDDWILVAVFASASLFLETVARLVKQAFEKHLSLLKV